MTEPLTKAELHTVVGLLKRSMIDAREGFKNYGHKLSLEDQETSRTMFVRNDALIVKIETLEKEAV